MIARSLVCVVAEHTMILTCTRLLAVCMPPFNSDFLVDELNNTGKSTSDLRPRLTGLHSSVLRTRLNDLARCMSKNTSASILHLSLSSNIHQGPPERLCAARCETLAIDAFVVGLNAGRSFCYCTQKSTCCRMADFVHLKLLVGHHLPPRLVDLHVLCLYSNALDGFIRQQTCEPYVVNALRLYATLLCQTTSRNLSSDHDVNSFELSHLF